MNVSGRTPAAPAFPFRATLTLAAAFTASALAVWLLPASLHIADWPRSGPHRIAVFAPLYRLWMIGAVTVLTAVVLFAARRRVPGGIGRVAHVLAPLNLLWLWTLPYWPWLAEQTPVAHRPRGPPPLDLRGDGSRRRGGARCSSCSILARRPAGAADGICAVAGRVHRLRAAVAGDGGSRRRRTTLPGHHAQPARRSRSEDRKQPHGRRLPSVLPRRPPSRLSAARDRRRDLLDPRAGPVGPAAARLCDRRRARRGGDGQRAGRTRRGWRSSTWPCWSRLRASPG